MPALVRNIALALVLFVCLATPRAAFAQGSPDPAGVWHGALQTPQGPFETGGSEPVRKTRRVNTHRTECLRPLVRWAFSTGVQTCAGQEGK